MISIQTEQVRENSWGVGGYKHGRLVTIILSHSTGFLRLPNRPSVLVVLLLNCLYRARSM